MAYRAALQGTLRKLAAAYGYTLAIGTSIATLTATHGSPGTGEIVLFAAGGLVAFGLLDGILQVLPSRQSRDPEAAFPFAGVLNVVSVSAALAAATLLAQAVHGSLAWLLTPLAATGIYLLVVAAQVVAVDRLRR
jgi:hypothetical protein